MEGNRLLTWVVLFFYSQLVVSTIPKILLGGNDGPLGWGAMLFIYHLGGMAKISDMMDVGEIKNLQTLNKLVVLIIFWPLYVNWREVLNPIKNEPGD